jgi:putative ABC transport system permease protein
VLKGKIAGGFRNSNLRSFLVVFQFAISIFLIIGTLVIYNQLKFIQNKDLGYKRDQVLMVYNVSSLGDGARILKQEVKQLAGVRNATLTGFTPVNGWRNNGSVFKDHSMNARQGTLTQLWDVDPDYIPTMGMTVISGRNFSDKMATDSSAMIINEASARLMGFANPIGETVQYGSRNYTVIGVTKDMIRGDPFLKIAPSFYCLQGFPPGTIEIRLNTQLPTGEALRRTRAVFSKYNPRSPFTYRFVDEEYGKKFGNEQRIGRLASFFAALAIFISCLGLFGLASFVAEQRTKEIGIRKVLGASIAQVWRLLSWEFFALVGVALLIATPIAYFLMHRWLENYENHTGMPWWVFAAAGGGALALTLLTVSFQAIKAGLTNPVKSLRSE